MKLVNTLYADACNVFDGCGNSQQCVVVDGEFRCLRSCDVAQPMTALYLEQTKLSTTCLCNGRLCRSGNKCINDSLLSLSGLHYSGTYCLADCPGGSMMNVDAYCFCARSPSSPGVYPAICYIGETCSSSSGRTACLDYCVASYMNVLIGSGSCGCGRSMCDLATNVCYNQTNGKNGIASGSKCVPQCDANYIAAQACFCGGLCGAGNYCTTGRVCQCRFGGYGPCKTDLVTCAAGTIYNGAICQDATKACSGSDLNTFATQTVCKCGSTVCLVYDAQACVTNYQTGSIEGCLPICAVGAVTQKCGCSGAAGATFAAQGQKCYEDGRVSCPENVILKIPCMCSDSLCEAGNSCYRRAGYVAVCAKACVDGRESKAGCICYESDPYNTRNELFCANNINNDGNKAFCIQRQSHSKPQNPGDYQVCLRGCDAGYVGASVPCKCKNLLKEAKYCPETYYCAGGSIGIDDSTICGVPCGNSQVLNADDECVCRTNYTAQQSVCRTGQWCTGMIRGNTHNSAYTYMPNDKGNSACVKTLCVDGVIPKSVDLCKIHDDADVPACNYKSYAFRAQQAEHQCIKICDHQQSGVDDDFGYHTGLQKCVCNSYTASAFFFCYPKTGDNANIFCTSMTRDSAVTDLPVPSQASECVPGCMQGYLGAGDYCKCERDQTVAACAQDAQLLHYCAGGTAITSQTVRCVLPCTDAKSVSQGCVCSTVFDNQSSVCGINNQSKRPYCTGMQYDVSFPATLRPSASGKCVALCAQGENTLSEACRCWGSAMRVPCEKGYFCLYGDPATPSADLFRFKCEDGVATERGDAELDGTLKGCVCNSSNYKSLDISVCRGTYYCVSMQANWPGTESRCVQKCQHLGINDSGDACKCEKDRNKPGCPAGHYCVAGDIAIAAACVPVCTYAKAPVSGVNLSDGCICNSDYSSRASICSPGLYCLKMGGTASGPLPSAAAQCVPLCKNEILGAECKCLQAPQSDPCYQGFYCQNPGYTDAKCIPPCTNEAAGDLGCLCNTAALICPKGKYCLNMDAGPTVGNAGMCVDLCTYTGEVGTPCKCEHTAASAPCSVGRFCVGEAGVNASCYDRCGDASASASPGAKCVCASDLLSTASLCTGSYYCTGMYLAFGKYYPTQTAICLPLCASGENKSSATCRCTLNAHSPGCSPQHFCVAGRPGIDSTSVCLEDECSTTPAGPSGCACSIVYQSPSTACYGNKYCVGLAKDYSQTAAGECVPTCTLGLVVDACRCILDMRERACSPGQFCAGGEPEINAYCMTSCGINTNASERCVCSTEYREAGSVCEKGYFCLSFEYEPTSMIPDSGNICMRECEFNQQGGDGCYCYNYGLCAGSNYCATLPNLTYECLPACTPHQPSGAGCFCVNNGYCMGAYICEARGCYVYECQTDADCVTQNYFCYNFKCTHCSQMFAACALCDSSGCWAVDSGNNSVRPPNPEECLLPRYYYSDDPARCVRCPDNNHAVGYTCKSSLCTINSDCYSDEYFCNNLMCTYCIHFPVDKCVKCNNSACLQVDHGDGPRAVTIVDCKGPYYYNFGAIPSCSQCSTDQFSYKNACVPTNCNEDADCRFSDLYCSNKYCKACAFLMNGCSYCDSRGCHYINGAAVSGAQDCVAPLVFDTDKCRVCGGKYRYKNGVCTSAVYVAVIAGSVAAAVVATVIIAIIVCCIMRRRIRQTKAANYASIPSASPVRMSDQVPSECAVGFRSPLPYTSFVRNSASVVSLIPPQENYHKPVHSNLYRYSTLKSVASVASLQNLSTVETDVDGEEMMMFKVPRNNMRKYYSQIQLEKYNPK